MGIAQKGEHPRGQTPQSSSRGTPLLAESGLHSCVPQRGMRMAIGLFGRLNVEQIERAERHYQPANQHRFRRGRHHRRPGRQTNLGSCRVLGPVLFIDTAGIDDDQKPLANCAPNAQKVFDRCDTGVIMTEGWHLGSPYEEEIASQLSKRSIPLIIVCNKTDLLPLAPKGLIPTPLARPKSHTAGTVVAPRKRLSQHAAAPFP